VKPYPNFRYLEYLTGVTWQDLVELEPRLGALLWRARQAGAGCLCWADVDRAFPPIRSALIELLGFTGHTAPHPALGRTGAYEVACWKLYDAVAGLVPVPAGGEANGPGKQVGQPAGETGPLEAAGAAIASPARWTTP
jgi:hypothetical protein